MGKIGRNDPCFCGSGLKFKKCCLTKIQNKEPDPAQPPQVSLKNEIESIQQSAVAKKKSLHALGVFILFSTESGDGWLLEITDMDALQVAAGGEKLEVELVENPETIEVNWSHKFTVKNKKFITTAYADKNVTTYDDYPTHRIHSAVKKCRQKFTPELLNSLHVSQDEE